MNVTEKISLGELFQRQSLPLEAKEIHSIRVIEQALDFCDGNAYISYSGGIDSDVLKHLVRRVQKDTPAVFLNTGLEWPEIVQHVREDDNVTWLRSKMRYEDVLEHYGYPLISKSQAQYISEYRSTKSQYLRDKRLGTYANGKTRFCISEKWRFMIDAPFKISDRCCHVMKKGPAKKYEHETGRLPFIGTMAVESNDRRLQYLRQGCNAFDNTRPISNPLSIWTKKDVHEYMEKYGLKHAAIYDKGEDSTGCIFCLFGIHMEKEPNRLQRMKVIHPKLYRHCMDRLGMREVLEYMNKEVRIPYE
jgi:3'-phosphoadenosine 5'-phosphosulfate sulfotransferase (PAPS reductase)/FAD synthetase